MSTTVFVDNSHELIFDFSFHFFFVEEKNSTRNQTEIPLENSILCVSRMEPMQCTMKGQGTVSSRYKFTTK